MATNLGWPIHLDVVNFCIRDVILRVTPNRTPLPPFIAQKITIVPAHIIRRELDHLAAIGDGDHVHEAVTTKAVAA